MSFLSGHFTQVKETSQRHVSLAFHYSAIWALNCLCQITVNLKGILTIFFCLAFITLTAEMALVRLHTRAASAVCILVTYTIAPKSNALAHSLFFGKAVSLYVFL